MDGLSKITKSADLGSFRRMDRHYSIRATTVRGENSRRRLNGAVFDWRERVTFFEGDAEFFQQVMVLVDESMSSVMLFLITDILNHVWNMRLAIGESTIAFLPRKTAADESFLVDPFGGVAFD